MLSRVADSIFWMSRYIERAENVARFIDVNLNLALDLGPRARRRQWAPLVDTTGDHERFVERYGEPDQQQRDRVPDLRRATTRTRSSPACAPPAKTPARSAR